MSFRVCDQAIVRNHHAGFEDDSLSNDDVNVVAELRSGPEPKYRFVFGPATRDVEFAIQRYIVLDVDSGVPTHFG